MAYIHNDPWNKLYAFSYIAEIVVWLQETSGWCVTCLMIMVENAQGSKRRHNVNPLATDNAWTLPYDTKS